MNRELHSAVCDDPGNLVPRLVYADWLEEQGDVRAEFVRAQIRLAELEQSRPPMDESVLSVSHAAADLLAEHRSHWNGELHRLLIGTPLRNGVGRRQPIRRWSYRRGFVEFLVVRAAAFEQHADVLRTLGPIRGVRLVAIDEHVDWPRIVAQPLLSQLETFALNVPYTYPPNPVSNRVAKILADSEAIRRLPTFRVHGHAPALFRVSRRIPGYQDDRPVPVD